MVKILILNNGMKHMLAAQFEKEKTKPSSRLGLFTYKMELKLGLHVIYRNQGLSCTTNFIHFVYTEEISNFFLHFSPIAS